MRWRRYVIALLALLLLSIAVSFFFASRRELIVHGKPVSEWVLALGGPAPTGPAKEVIKTFGPEAVPDLVRMLRTRDSLFARPLHALAPKLPRRVDARLRRLFQVNETVQRRYTATMALGLMGTNAAAAMPALIEALRDKTMTVSMTAALDLGRLGSMSLPGLIKTLDDSSASARRAAMTGLIQLGPTAADAVPKLVRLLGNPPDRPAARMALQAIGKPAVPALIERLNDPSEERRIEAIEILGHIGLPARAAIPSLIGVSQDQSRAVRSNAIRALAKICRWCDPVISALQDALNDESWAIRRAAAHHLSAEPRAAPQTVQMLIHKIAEGASTDKQRAINSLGMMGSAAQGAVPVLKTLAEGDNGNERALAREALQHILGAPVKAED